MTTFAKSPPAPSAKRLNPWTKATSLDTSSLKLDSPAALDAAKKQRLREVIPKDGPTVKISQGKDGRHRVYVALNDGTKRKYNSTCRTAKDARDRVADFLAGIGTEHREPAVLPQSVRESPRHHMKSDVQPPRKYNKTHHVAGPGRGIHTPTTRASALIEGEKLALSKALMDGLVDTDFMQTEHIYQRALEIIDNQSKHGEEAVAAAITQAVAAGRRKVTARGAVSDRQVRRHKTAVKMAIESQAGPAIAAQIALAETVLQDLNGKMDVANANHRNTQLQQLDTRTKNDCLASEFVMKSLRHSIAVMKDRVGGHRPTTKDRQTLQTMLSAATNQVPQGLRTATSRLLDVKFNNVS